MILLACYADFSGVFLGLLFIILYFIFCILIPIWVTLKNTKKNSIITSVTSSFLSLLFCWLLVQSGGNLSLGYLIPSWLFIMGSLVPSLLCLLLTLFIHRNKQ
jgi:hypothetical protein